MDYYLIAGLVVGLYLVPLLVTRYWMKVAHSYMGRWYGLTLNFFDFFACVCPFVNIATLVTIMFRWSPLAEKYRKKRLERAFGKLIGMNGGIVNWFFGKN